jgi:uridine phosphorylase
MKDHRKDKTEFTRRDFIRVGATGATGVALASLGALNVAAAAPVAKLPRRRYGRTGLEISALVGAADWNPASSRWRSKPG